MLVFWTHELTESPKRLVFPTCDSENESHFRHPGEPVLVDYASFWWREKAAMAVLRPPLVSSPAGF